MGTSKTTTRAGGGSGLTWWAASGFALGIGALLQLVAVASATPVDASAGGSLGAGFLGGELGVRSAGIMIFVAVTATLFAQSARHSRMLEAEERKRNPRARE